MDDRYAFTRSSTIDASLLDKHRWPMHRHRLISARRPSVGHVDSGKRNLEGGLSRWNPIVVSPYKENQLNPSCSHDSPMTPKTEKPLHSLWWQACMVPCLCLQTPAAVFNANTGSRRTILVGTLLRAPSHPIDAGKAGIAFLCHV